MYVKLSSDMSIMHIYIYIFLICVYIYISLSLYVEAPRRPTSSLSSMVSSVAPQGTLLSLARVGPA